MYDIASNFLFYNLSVFYVQISVNIENPNSHKHDVENGN